MSADRSQSHPGEPVRTPAAIRVSGNRLKHEMSLYLRQHAHNPVDWFAWGDEALNRAKAEQKPIFLSIGYSSCHWCHVMAHEAFEDDEVAAFLNRHFVSIKVDREERPDLDATYMDAVMAMTGSGGWPMSAFLTPDLKPFYGGTYFPKETFLSVLGQIQRVFGENRRAVDDQAERLVSILAQHDRQRQSGLPDETALDEAVRLAIRRYDNVHGGFSGAQKFPTPLVWQFLLTRFRRTGDDLLGGLVRRTLDAMGEGGLHDHVGGGFHRYTVDASWTVPHFEKMLYDNAQLAALYTEAAAVFGEARYAEIARATLDFLIRDLSDEEGAFFASLDADSGGEEGSFYVWTPAEVLAAAGPTDGPALAMLFGVSEGGNFEGKNVLTRRVPPEQVGRIYPATTTPVDKLVGHYAPLLRQTRAERAAPGLDRKVVTSWNGLAISAFARAALHFNDESYRRAASRAADFLLERHRLSDGGLARAANEGRQTGPGMLTDYALFSIGLFDLFQATGAWRYLEEGRRLLELSLSRFRDPAGGFFNTADNAETPLGRRSEIYDSVRPSGNGAMLNALLTAVALTGEPRYREEAETLLRTHGGTLRQMGLEMSAWLIGLERYLGPYYEATIVGEPDEAETQSLIAAFAALCPANAVLIRLDESSLSAAQALAPVAADKGRLNGKPTAWVCRYGLCQKPTRDPAELRQQLLEGWSR
ncbi:MAG: thioredoxin domain-containing protein [Myxococcales bacterium]|nr:MAG: thioredoxin domain-containing protein [Myxococcales bacterium]